MKGPSSFPKILCHVLLLALTGSTAFAQEPQLRRQEDLRPAPRIETSRQLDNAQKPKTSLDVPRAADPTPRDDVSLNPDAMRKNWLECEQSAQELQEQFNALQLQHTSLQQQVQVLQQQLKEATHPGGSAVTAYCENANVSRNTAGASTDCGRYRCEEVSGLCRTQCNVASECKEGYVCNYGECILSE